jgi:hypothetical protein
MATPASLLTSTHMHAPSDFVGALLKSSYHHEHYQAMFARSCNLNKKFKTNTTT